MMRRRFINSANNVPLSFEALEDGMSVSLSGPTAASYSVNFGAWTTIAGNGYTIEVDRGSIISFKDSRDLRADGSVGTFYISKMARVFGNCMSIIPQVFDKTQVQKNLFYGLFDSCDTLVDASGLMLPATTLADQCYCQMFEKCTSLVAAPELPATTLAPDCYDYMFNGCTSLVSAPKLPATTLAPRCYKYMFNRCSKLARITMLATDISAAECLYGWVASVAPTGVFTKHKDMNSLPTGTDGIPSGWTVIDA